MQLFASTTDVETTAAPTSSATVTPRPSPPEQPGAATEDGGRGGMLRQLSRQAALAGWRLTTGCVVVGAITGVGYALYLPDEYTAEARLSVGSQELSAQSVPGYVVALRDLTSNYARYVETTDAVRDDLRARAGDDAATLQEVAASPIPDSNILRLEVTGTDPDVAVQAVDRLAQGLIDQVAAGASSIDTARETLVAASTALATAQQEHESAKRALDRVLADPAATPADVDPRRQAVATAFSTLSVRGVEQEATATAFRNASEDSSASASLSVVRSAAITRDDGASSLQKWGALGAIIGGVLAFLVAFARHRGQQVRERRAGTRLGAADEGVSSQTSP